MLTELIKELKKNDFNVTYGAWGQGRAPKLPYLVILETEDDSLFADNKRYFKVSSYDVELYFDKKDPNLELKLESFFDDQNIPFLKTSDVYIADDRFFEKVYQIEIGENYGS